jgi:hypothetical protein
MFWGFLFYGGMVMNFEELKNLRSCLIDCNKIEELDDIFLSAIKSGSKFLSDAPYVGTSWREIDEYVVPIGDYSAFFADISSHQELVDIVREMAISKIAPRLEQQFLSGSDSCYAFTSMLKASTERELCVEKPEIDSSLCVSHLVEISASVNGRVDFVVMSSDTLAKTGFSIPDVSVFVNEYAGDSVYAGLWLDSTSAENGVIVTCPTIRGVTMKYSRKKYSLQRGILGLSADSGAVLCKEKGIGTALYVKAYLGFFVKGSGVFRMDGF